LWVPTFDIAHINGIYIKREGSDSEEWRVEINMEEDGTHSTVLLRLSPLNASILREVLEKTTRKIGTK
jgi:hypothetical protein